MTTILFIRIKPKKDKDGSDSEPIPISMVKSEISGYIDLAHRMKTEDFRPIFMGKRHLIPKASDLSYYNWDSQLCYLSDSPNFRVDANSEEGLLFRNKRDRKVINVNPAEKPGDGTDREEIECPDWYT